MREALQAAQQSGERGDYPIGAAIVKDGKVVALGYETLKSTNDPVNGHAEIDAIRKATSEVLQSHYLEGCTLYSTHEPCPMCTAAAFWAKIDTIVYAVSREDMVEQMKAQKGEAFSWRQIILGCKEILSHGIGHTVQVVPGVLRDEGLKLFGYTK